MQTYREQGPIRPPSEARSLLLRVTRNCPWNKCTFCSTYKDEKFSLRPLEEIKGEIDYIARIAGMLKELSQRQGEGGLITERLIQIFFNSKSGLSGDERAIALWLHYGGHDVFIQDADSLIIETAMMNSILRYLKEIFPFVNQITTYCRSRTAIRKSLEELIMLKEAGLTRIHVGMESGSDRVLNLIRKGATAVEHVEGGKRIKSAGISLCEYIIPGLGGKTLSREHASDTARVVNAINPDFVRLRSLYVIEGTPLSKAMESGEFEPLGDEDVLREIWDLISGLEGVNTTIVSDHMLNLLEEVEGTLPADKAKMLAVIDKYFSLVDEERLIFRLGRRSGIYHRIGDLEEDNTHQQLKAVVEQYEKKGKGSTERYLSSTRRHYI